jgi:hypothetical protein
VSQTLLWNSDRCIAKQSYLLKILTWCLLWPKDRRKWRKPGFIFVSPINRMRSAIHYKRQQSIRTKAHNIKRKVWKTKTKPNEAFVKQNFLVLSQNKFNNLKSQKLLQSDMKDHPYRLASDRIRFVPFYRSALANCHGSQPFFNSQRSIKMEKQGKSRNRVVETKFLLHDFKLFISFHNQLYWSLMDCLVN